MRVSSPNNVLATPHFSNGVSKFSYHSDKFQGIIHRLYNEELSGGVQTPTYTVYVHFA